MIIYIYVQQIFSRYLYFYTVNTRILFFNWILPFYAVHSNIDDLIEKVFEIYFTKIDTHPVKTIYLQYQRTYLSSLTVSKVNKFLLIRYSKKLNEKQSYNVQPFSTECFHTNFICRITFQTWNIHFENAVIMSLRANVLRI